MIYCQGHEDPQEQRLKERSKFNFQIKKRQDYAIQKQNHNN